MTLPELAVLLCDDKPQSGPIEDAELEAYCKYWSSLTPKERLEKVAERKKAER